MAATVAYGITEYSYYLDIKKSSDLCKMRIANLLATIFLLWARFFYYLWNVYQMMKIFIRDDNKFFIYAGGVVFFLFLGFNLGAVLLPYFQKTFKFFKTSAKENEKEENLVHKTKKW